MFALHSIRNNGKMESVHTESKRRCGSGAHSKIEYTIEVSLCSARENVA